MTSPGHKIGQILKLIYLRQYLSYSVDQKLKMSEMLMAIFLVYSTSGITSGKNVCRAQYGGHFENFEILNTASIWSQISKDRPKLCHYSLYGDDVIDDVTGSPQSFSLYSCLGEVGSGSKLQGLCLVNKCQYHNCLSRLYLPKYDLNDYTFRDCRSKVNITGLLDDLGTNKQYCKLSKIQLFFRLWRHR